MPREQGIDMETTHMDQMRTGVASLTLPVEAVDVYATSSPAWATPRFLAAYTPILVVDADAFRAQRVARLLTLAGYRPIVASNPVEAFTRCMRGPWSPAAALIGAVGLANPLPLNRLLEHLARQRGSALPVLSLPPLAPDVAPIHVDPALPFFHTSSPESLAFFEDLWRILPQTRAMPATPTRTLALDRLPQEGLAPRTAQRLRSSSHAFRRTLNAAALLVARQGRSLAQWRTLLNDVGLAHVVSLTRWPTTAALAQPWDATNDDDLDETPDELIVPAVDLSCLHQAMIFSRPSDPFAQTYAWGALAAESSLQRRKGGFLAQQALKLLSRERAMQAALNAFTHELDEVRGEQLHVWRAQPDASYLLVHYSNLYVYGRMWRQEPTCHVWLGALDATLSSIHQDDQWTFAELECSCQTLTGHCVFAIRPRQ